MNKKNKSSKNPKPKIRVGILFGGRSAEHEVSLVSATSIIQSLDKGKYDVVPIGITPEGRWISGPNVALALKQNGRTNLPEKILLPDPTRNGLVGLDGTGTSEATQKIDVIFPVLHGTYGEDGTVQGLLELAGIPYVGAGVLGSAAGMDKVVTKQLCELYGIPVAPYLSYLASEYRSDKKKVLTQSEKELGYPVFVKPANSGSSVGISKAHTRKEFIAALEMAMLYDRKLLIEKAIENAREIEISVLGNDRPEASVPGEIVSSNEFYDYDAKYVDGKSTAIIPAKFPSTITKKLQAMAIQSYRAIDCAGMARVDFLVGKRTNRIYLNEINTIPGFTSISMYPKLWKASGISYSVLLDRLINLAIERFNAKQKLRTTYQPKKKWYAE